MKRGLNMNYGKIFLVLFAGFVFVFLMVPSLMTIPMSFSNSSFLVFPPRGFTLNWYHTFLTDQSWVTATIFSLKLATLTALLSLVFGSMASLGLVRGSLPGRRILNLFFISPMMIPVIILAFAVYGLYAKFRLIGSTMGLVLGHTVLCTPFVILVVTANLQRFDISLELAARNLGANAIKTFWFVTMPLIKPGLMAAGIFSFITSLDDLVVAMFLIGTKLNTLPIKMFSQIQYRIDPVVAAASSTFILASFGVIVALATIRRDTKIKSTKEEVG